MEDKAAIAQTPRPHQWTRWEYRQLASVELFHEQRIELIEGQIIDMSPMVSPHATAVKLVDMALQAAYPPGYFTRCQLPLALGKYSEPQPDVAVIQGQIRDFIDEHPQTAILVVEVADSSLEFDRVVKSSLYAKAGIADYWLLNLGQRQLETYQNPIQDNGARSGYAYSARQIMPQQGQVRLPGLSQSLAVADLLP